MPVEYGYYSNNRFYATTVINLHARIQNRTSLKVHLMVLKFIKMNEILVYKVINSESVFSHIIVGKKVNFALNVPPPLPLAANIFCIDYCLKEIYFLLLCAFFLLGKKVFYRANAQLF